jgi:predicted O-methyltransferase YrrM
LLKDLAAQNRNGFDFIFLDAAKAQYMNFLPEIMKLLKVGGLFITDNVLQDGTIAESRYGITRRDRTIHTRMREYLFTITHMEQLETAVIPLGDGVTLSTKVKD